MAPFVDAVNGLAYISYMEYCYGMTIDGFCEIRVGKALPHTN